MDRVARAQQRQRIELAGAVLERRLASALGFANDRQGVFVERDRLAVAALKEGHPGLDRLVKRMIGIGGHREGVVPAAAQAILFGQRELHPAFEFRPLAPGVFCGHFQCGWLRDELRRRVLKHLNQRRAHEVFGELADQGRVEWIAENARQGLVAGIIV